MIQEMQINNLNHMNFKCSLQNQTQLTPKHKSIHLLLLLLIIINTILLSLSLLLSLLLLLLLLLWCYGTADK